MSHPRRKAVGIPFYRNVRIVAMLAQIVFALGIIVLGWFMCSTMLANMRNQGIPISFAFLHQPAGFGISEGLSFDPSQSYLRAFGVGIVNTLRTAVVGIILATLLGIALGVARLSGNWLLQRLATLYIETFRNVPLLLWLIFTYAAIRESFPRLREGLSLLWGMVLMSNRGIALAWPRTSATGEAFWFWLLGSVAAGLGVWFWSKRHASRDDAVFASHALGCGFCVGAVVLLAGFLITWMTGRLPDHATVDAAASVAYTDLNGNGTWDEAEPTLAGVRVTLQGLDGSVSRRTQADGRYQFTPMPAMVRGATVSVSAPLFWSIPRIRGFNYSGGTVLSPEFAALLFGLVVYTAAFIAEIVRAGILAVPKGQSEAAHALGLSHRQTFVLIVFPQALRVIIPPLINQYLNLTKNSSLAIAVGYPDLFSVGLTINNQTGQAIPFVIMIMVTYLSMSLLTSALLNMVNQRLALKTS